MSNGAGFALNVKQWIQSTKLNQDRVLRGIVAELAQQVVMRTPVDNGMARGGWQAGVNSHPFNPTTADPAGQETLTDIAAEARPAKMGDIVYLVNNIEYINMIEFGGWVPPEFVPGQFHKDTRPGPNHGKWNIRTTMEGFSIQAPQGMARSAIVAIQAKFSQIVAKAIANMPDISAGDLEGLV